MRMVRFCSIIPLMLIGKARQRQRSNGLPESGVMDEPGHSAVHWLKAPARMAEYCRPDSEFIMLLTLLRAKIHGAIITQANRNYVGSITIDLDLLKLCGLLPNERVLVADIHNGVRFETYILAGKKGSGVIGINGAAAHLVKPGEKIIIMAFAEMTPEEATDHMARVLVLDSSNKPVKNMTIASRLDA